MHAPEERAVVNPVLPVVEFRDRVGNSRHTAGTLGYLHTGDLRAVQDFMGHADPRMTAKYAHVVDMAKKNPARFIPAKMG